MPKEEKRYTPELGQMAFGQPWKEFEVPEWLEAFLEYIRQEVSRVEWNNRQEEFDPFGNSGLEYKTDKFEVKAYSWGEEEQPYNFKWRDFEVSWYKYLGRGTTMNREISLKEGREMLDECLRSVRANEKPLY